MRQLFVLHKVNSCWPDTYDNKCIFLSSIDIQMRYWIKLNITNSENHMPIPVIRQAYIESLNKSKNLLQIIDVYIFLFGEKIYFNKTEFQDWHKRTDQQWPQIRKKLRQALFDFIYNQRGYFYLNIVSISRYLNQFVLENKISRIKTLMLEQNNRESNQKLNRFQILKNLLIGKINSCIEESYNSFKQKIKNFIEKDLERNISVKILSKIYLKAESQILKLEPNPQAQVQLILQNLSASEQKLLKQNIGIHTQKQLFQLSSNKQKKQTIKAYGTAGFLYKLLGEFKNQIHPILDQTFKQQVKKYDAKLLGNMFQRYFVQFIKLKNSTIIFKINEDFQNFCFYQQKVLKFDPIPRGSQDLKQYSIISQLKSSFRYLIEQTQKLKYFTLFFEPRNNSKKYQLEYQKNLNYQEQIDSNSKAIDIIFMKLSNQRRQNKQVIQIWILDLGTTNKKQKVQNNKKRFWNNFIHLKENTSQLYDYGKKITTKLDYQKQFEINEINEQSLQKKSFKKLINEEFFIQIRFYVVGHQVVQLQNQNFKRKPKIYEEQMQKYPLIKKISSVNMFQVQFSQMLRYPILTQSQKNYIYKINKIRSRIIEKMQMNKVNQ